MTPERAREGAVAPPPAPCAGARRLALLPFEYLKDLRGLPHDLRLAHENGGRRAVWRELRKHSLDRIHRRRSYLVLEHALDRLREVEPPAGVEIDLFTGPDWSRLAELASGPKLRTFPRLAAGGRTCLVAWRGGQPIGYAWLSDRVEPEFEVYPLPLPPDAAFLNEFYVAPQERNRGVGAALLTARVRLARSRGFRKLWCVIARGNHPSLRVFSKAFGGDVRVAGEATSRRLLTRTQVSYTPQASAPSEALHPTPPHRRSRERAVPRGQAQEPREG